MSNESMGMDEFLQSRAESLPFEHQLEFEQMKREVFSLCREDIQNRLLSIQQLIAIRWNFEKGMANLSAVRTELDLHQKFELFQSQKNMGELAREQLCQLLLYAVLDYFEQTQRLQNAFRSGPMEIMNNAGINE